jgi:hypothetical protein
LPCRPYARTPRPSGEIHNTPDDLAKRNMASSAVQDQVVYVGSLDGNLCALM